MNKTKKPTKKRKLWNVENLKLAVQSVKDGSTIRAASINFKIPFSTLHSRVSERFPLDAKPGPATVLSKKEEEELVQWLLQMSERGFPVSKDQLFDKVQKIIKDSGRKTVFNNGRPSRHWFEGFIRRNPQLSQRVGKSAPMTKTSITEPQIRKWFEETGSYLAKKNLLNIDKNRVYNMEEAGFLLCDNNDKVIINKRERSKYKASKSDKKCYTVVVGGNAAGQLIPTMVIFNNLNLPLELVKMFPSDFVIGKSKTGWLAKEIFYEYIANFFHPWLVNNNITFPVILYVNTHSSHLSQPLKDFCIEKNIELISLLPNVNLGIHPMNHVYTELNITYKDEIRKYKLENNEQQLTKFYFAPVLKKALSNFDWTILENAFISSGLVPFSANNIFYDKLDRQKRRVTVSEPEITSPEKDNQLILNAIESKIEENVLAEFKRHLSNDWTGAEKYKELFKVWYSFKNVSDKEYEPQEEDPIKLSNSDVDDIETDDDEKINFIVLKEEMILN